MKTFFTINYSYLIPRSTIYKNDMKIMNKKKLTNANNLINRVRNVPK